MCVCVSVCVCVYVGIEGGGREGGGIASGEGRGIERKKEGRGAVCVRWVV